MIKYNLSCKCGKTFESWFASSSEFDSLSKRKMVKCIYCESTSINKTLMAPRLTRKSSQIIKKSKLEKDIKIKLKMVIHILNPPGGDKRLRIDFNSTKISMTCITILTNLLLGRMYLQTNKPVYEVLL